MARLFSLVLLVTSFSSPAESALARTTVAVAPFASASSQEYQWIGEGLANASSQRMYASTKVNALTVRQVSAAMRQDNIAPSDVTEMRHAAQLGRQLGADTLVTGTYSASWPDIEIALLVIEPAKKRVLASRTLKGDLGDLLALEVNIAEVLNETLALDAPIERGGFGTKVMRAWRQVTLASQILRWQSLSPRRAAPSAPPALPPAALKKAASHLERAVELDPRYEQAWSMLAVAYAVQGRKDEARRAIAKANEKGSSAAPETVLAQSFMAMRAAEPDEAAKILKEAIDEHPGFLHARGYLGELYNHEGEYEQAKQAFTEYLEVAPKQPWALAQLGYAKSRLGDHAGAIAATIEAVDLVPRSPYLLIELASRYIDANKMVGAEDALRHALELFPNEGRIYVRLGYVFLRQGNPQASIAISEKGLALSNTDERQRDRAYALLNLARAHGQLGELDSAFRHLKAALAAGIKSVEELENDPKLTKLRADPRYRQLLSKQR